MSFSDTSRIIALDPELVETLFPALFAEYAEELQDGDRMIPTIGGHRDREDSDELRAASLHDGTIQGMPLTDGRVAYIAFWQSDLEAAFLSDGLLGVEELTLAEFEALRPAGGIL